MCLRTKDTEGHPEGNYENTPHTWTHRNTPLENFKMGLFTSI